MKKQAVFCLSKRFMSVYDREDVIWQCMGKYGMSKIDKSWDSPDGEIRYFSGPVETFDQVVGMLLTRKA